MVKIREKRNIALLAPIPALLVGAIVMHHNELSPLIYGQNIICYLVLGLPLFLLGAKPICLMGDNQVKVAILLLGSLLTCTFLDAGLENVYRWLTVGGFRLYISSIVLPCIIIGLSLQLQKGNTIFPFVVVTLILLILALQPDASQLSAFAAAITFLIWTQSKKQFPKYGALLLSAGFVIYSWLYIDALKAVAHVEDILLLALNMGMVWFFLGIISLVLLLAPFLGFAKTALQARAIGLYYLVVLGSTFFGNFPVPLMGFGVSPLIGYLLALFLLFRANSSNWMLGVPRGRGFDTL